jgi:DNA-binding HxlR family transcriptional regulator
VPTTPVQIRYTPSASGEELVRALQPLIAWGARRLEQQAERGLPVREFGRHRE